MHYKTHIFNKSNSDRIIKYTRNLLLLSMTGVFLSLYGCKKETPQIGNSGNELGEEHTPNENTIDTEQDYDDLLSETDFNQTAGEETNIPDSQPENSAGAMISLDTASFPAADICKFSDNPNSDFIFYSDSTLNNLKLYNIKNDGYDREINRIYYQTDIFHSQTALHVIANIAEINSDFAVEYTDSSGNSKNFLVITDGNRNVQLQEIQRIPANDEEYRNKIILSQRKNISLDIYNDIRELNLSEEGNADIVLTADSTLSDLTIHRTEFDFEEMKYSIDDLHAEIDTFSVESALHITAYIPELYPDLILIYRDEQGAEQYYTISSDMRYGDISLVKVNKEDIKN